MKLVVTPHPSSWPKAGRDFTVVVDYSGAPQVITDPDTSIEGWIRACYPLTRPQTCDGAFVVNEPMGAQTLVPVEQLPDRQGHLRHPHHRARPRKTRSASASSPSRTDNGDGTATWRWTEDDPTATYLTTATVGDFIYRRAR